MRHRRPVTWTFHHPCHDENVLQITWNIFLPTKPIDLDSDYFLVGLVWCAEDLAGSLAHDPMQ
jgi:hypothetical protein